MEIRGEIRRQGKKVDEKIKSGEREKAELKEEIVDIKRKVKELVERKGGKVGRGEGKDIEEIVERRVKGMERWREMQERNKRRRNVVIKGLEMDKRGLKEEVGRL